MTYDKEYFKLSSPNIEDNDYLREPQKLAYQKVYNHFILERKNTHAIVVLPTGVGKTGLMGLFPYGISNGRVLIITPQVVIKETVLESLDPRNSENFWLKRNVFSKVSELPVLVEYEGLRTKKEWLYMSNIVILNIHKLQQRLDSSLLNIVDENFFDMIIIDEAHHSTASTWVQATNYFKDVKVIKLTGTPFRTDNEKIMGEEIYKYKLSQAMAKGYVKSLEKFYYIPNELYLTIDGNKDKKYTVEEVFSILNKDENFISRSVAFSTECSLSVVEESIKLLNKKLDHNSAIPHKIIAVACSIEHAIETKDLYESKNLKCAIIHSKLDEHIKESTLKDIENHRVQVVINVSMLGEGYDHPYLSIAAIFRPYRYALPYAQFIGRILRKIPAEEGATATDNIGQIVTHKLLYLDELWNYYKNEIQESETIKYLEDIHIDDYDDEFSTPAEKRDYDTSIGNATENGEGKLVGESYLDTELLKLREKELKEERQKISELQKILNTSEEEARKILYSQKLREEKLKRPDLLYKQIGKDIDTRIREEIVPELLTRYHLGKNQDDIKDCFLFKHSSFKWIPNRTTSNAGMLAIYFNHALKVKLNRSKKDWTPEDYEKASSIVDSIYEYVDKVLESYLNSK